MTARILPFLLGLLLSFHFTSAQQCVPDGAIKLLDQWLEAQVDYDHLPSLTVGIVKDQQLIWSKGYGKADVSKNIPADPGTIYSICSISKLFTAVAIMKLRDEGKLQLDDEVSKYLPWFKVKHAAESGPITIRNVLSHSSGLPSEFDFPYWTEATFPDKEQIIKKVSEQSTLYPTSEYFQYSNMGIALLGFVVEQISGVPYEKYVSDNILSPLRLANTRPFFPDDLWRSKMATGYSELNRKGERRMLNKFQTKGLASAAGFTSNIDDLARFASWQFRVLDGKTEIIKSSTLHEMQRVNYMDPNWKTTWGLGFKVFQSDGKTFAGHGGYCPGYQTLLLMSPKDKIAYIIMINAVGTDPYKYFHGMRSILTKASEDKIKEKYNNPKLDEYCGLYSDLPWGAEVSITSWGDYLAIVSLPCENPKHVMTMLKPTATADVFTRIREDGEDGEEIRFERDKSNKIVKVWRNSNYRIKVK